MTERDRLIELLDRKQHQGNATETGVNYIQNSELADYLIKNGVIVLPCKVGDTVYQTDGVRIYASTIFEITHTSTTAIYVTENIVFDERAINNLIFLTKEEAESKLEEINENKYIKNGNGNEKDN